MKGELYMNEILSGVWQITELIHLFAPDLSRIKATDFKSEDGESDFSFMRFVFNENGDYYVYSDPNCTDLKHSGKWWQDEDGDYYYDPIITEGINPIIIDNLKILKIENGELQISIPMITFFLRKIK